MTRATHGDEIADVRCLRIVEPDRNDVVSVKSASLLAAELTREVELNVNLRSLLAGPPTDRCSTRTDPSAPEVAPNSRPGAADRIFVRFADDEAGAVAAQSFVPRLTSP